MASINRPSDPRSLPAPRYQRPQVSAFASQDGFKNVVYDWHHHPYHQLLYSFSGVIKLEVSDRFWLLPPQQAAWVRAATRHRTTIRDAESCSVHFDPAAYNFRMEDKICVFTSTSLLREMILYCLRWQNRPRRRSAAEKGFFTALAHYCAELAAERLPFTLPRAKAPGIQRAIDFAMDRLATVTSEEAAVAASMSERSFRRHFVPETGLRWKDFLHRARMLRAMELLSIKGLTIMEVSLEAGFSSLSAFGAAFAAFTGEKPKNYRRRVSAPEMAGRRGGQGRAS